MAAGVQVLTGVAGGPGHQYSSWWEQVLTKLFKDEEENLGQLLLKINEILSFLLDKYIKPSRYTQTKYCLLMLTYMRKRFLTPKILKKKTVNYEVFFTSCLLKEEKSLGESAASVETELSESLLGQF